MNSFRGRMIIAAVVVIVLGGVGFMLAASSGPTMARDARKVMDEFYFRSQKRDFRGARELLSPNLQGELSEEVLAQKWKLFEDRNGRIAQWKGAGAGLLFVTGDKVNLWPRYVDFNHTVRGDSGKAGQVAMRLVPEGEAWRIDRLSIQPVSWIGAREK